MVSYSDINQGPLAPFFVLFKTVLNKCLGYLFSFLAWQNNQLICIFGALGLTICFSREKTKYIEP